MDQDKQQNRPKRPRSGNRSRTGEPARGTPAGGTPNSGAGVRPAPHRDPLVHPGDEQDVTPDVIAGQGQPSKGGASQRGEHHTTDATGKPPGRGPDAQ